MGGACDMAVETFRTDEKNASSDKRRILQRVFSYLGQYRKEIILSIILMTVCSLIVIILPRIVEHAIDVDIMNKNVFALAKTVSLGFFLCLLWWLCNTVRMRKMAKVANSIVYKIRRDAFAHLGSLSLFYFDSRPTGKILSRLINDVTGMKDMMSQLVTSILPNIIMIVGILVAMLVSNWILALSAIVVVPLFIIATYFVTIKGFSNWENYRKKQSNLNAFSHENYSGIRIIQSFNAENETEATFENIINEVEAGWNKAVRRSDLMNIVWSMANGLGLISLYFIGYFILGTGKNEIGELVAFSSYLTLFWMPIRQLAMTYNQLTNNITAAGRVFELLDTPANILESPDAKACEIKDGSVCFSSVSFAYPDEPEKLILENLSFHVPKGRTIALVGATGAGKTTVINLIARFYDPVSGAVLIDGRDIRDMRFSDLRKAVSVMTQEPFLFSGTIRENLLYGNEDVEEEKIRSACRMIGVEKFILSLPDGYESKVVSSSFSQGQRQLLALARTLISDPRILILDEATSAIDTESEILVQKGMNLIMEGRTSFVVAHRLSTIRNADEIFVIQDKTIVECGNHENLVKKEHGIYRALYEAQFSTI